MLCRATPRASGWLGLMLTSQDHDRDAADEARWGRHWMDVGTGGWDRERRPSEVRLDRLLLPRARRRTARGRRPRPRRSSTPWWPRRGTCTRCADGHRASGRARGRVAPAAASRRGRWHARAPCEQRCVGASPLALAAAVHGRCRSRAAPAPTTSPAATRPSSRRRDQAAQARRFGALRQRRRRWRPSRASSTPSTPPPTRATVDARVLARPRVRAGATCWPATLPDVFLTSRIDLGRLRRRRRHPAGEPAARRARRRLRRPLLPRRRRRVRAWTTELQCMAYSVSPMVVYYNTDLVDFDKMERRGLDVPTPTRGRRASAGRSTEFGAAAEFAAAPRAAPRGVWIDPTLQGLAPFIYSGGGEVFDDDREPTSLAFSDDATREALEQTLPAPARPHPHAHQRPARRGDAAASCSSAASSAMIAGFRNLVPELRDAEDLDFDVLPMPTIDAARRSATSAGSASPPTPPCTATPPTSSPTPSPTPRRTGRRDRLHRAGQHRGRRLRRLPRPAASRPTPAVFNAQHPLHGGRRRSSTSAPALERASPRSSSICVTAPARSTSTRSPSEIDQASRTILPPEETRVADRAARPESPSE